MVKQISIFLENKCGRLTRVAQILAGAGINIRALSIADTSDFGILRLIVDRPEEACTILKEKDVMATVTEVIALEIPDVPGGLAGVLALLEKASINIEYLYSFMEKPARDALILMRVENISEALRVLQDNNVSVISGDRIYAM